jgi:hypothetical protein
MAQSDIGTKLYKANTGAGADFIPFINITAAPATGAAPSQIEVTELQELVKSYVLDRPDTPLFEFSYNYTESNYSAVVQEVSLTTAKDYLIVYGDGTGFQFSGQGATWVNEVTPGSAITAGLAFAVSSLAWKTSAQVTALLTP